jgi:hypothetical protein
MLFTRLAHGGISFSVSFDDPGSVFGGYHAGIEAAVMAAGQQWARHIATEHDSSIEVVVDFAAVPTANGSSWVSSFLATRNGLTIYEQGAAAEIRTGVDPNQAEPDVGITIGESFLTDTLFFATDVWGAPIPVTDVDGYSVILHELGHALVWNGWRDFTTVQLPADYASTFDELVNEGRSP